MKREKELFICRNISLLSLFMLILFISGCESLPEGEPPSGPIVAIENTADQPLSQKAAINQMITMLATSPELSVEKGKPLPNVIPGQAIIPENYKLQLAMIPVNVYSELLSMNIIDADPTKAPDYSLSSTFVTLPKKTAKSKPIVRWELSLRKPGVSQTAWTYSVKIILD